MAGLNSLHYQNINTPLHRLDIRIKLLFLLASNLILLNASWTHLGLMILPWFTLSLSSQWPFKLYLKDTKFIFVFLMFIFLTKLFFTPGQPVLSLPMLTITQEGLHDSCLIVARLALIIVLGILVVGSSRQKDMYAALEFFFKPIPLVPEKKIAHMISWMIRFIPSIMEQSEQIQEAQKSRGIQLQKRPIKQAVSLGATLMRHILVDSYQFAEALESRSFNEERTTETLTSTMMDWLILVSLMGYFGLVFLVGN